MSGRDEFSKREAEQIRALLTAIRRADRDSQKTLRAQLRRVGFRISDYDTSGEGFTAADFDGLVKRGTIRIGEGPRYVAALSSIDESPTTPVPPQTPEAVGSGEVVAAAEALTRRGAAIESAERVVPDCPGLYALRGDAGAWTDLGLGEPPDGRPLYVGKAEASLLKRDIRTHLGNGRTGSSTVRRSLAALLRSELDLHALPRNPDKPADFHSYGLSPSDDQKVTAWMRSNLRLAVWPNNEGAQLGLIESALLKRWCPPLNLKGVTTQWSAKLSAARKHMADEARNWAAS